MATEPKLVIFGIDGAGFDLVSDWAAAGKLPHLGALMAAGQSGPLISTNPPVTFPAWSSILTGQDPSYHGLTDFTVRKGYRVRFIGAQYRRLPTIFHHAEEAGLRAGAAWFPTTYPPEPLHGYQVAGWDSPVTSMGNAEFVHPRSLHHQLRNEFGNDHLLFDVVDEFADEDDWHSKAKSALVARVSKKSAVAQWLLEHHPTDLAAFYFGETDTIAHHFWAFHDPGSPRRPGVVDPRLETAVLEVYQAVDQAIGAILNKIGDRCAVMVVSDHGSGGASHYAVHLNRMLEQASLLRFKKTKRPGAFDASLLRASLPKLVPPVLRRHLFRFGGNLAPSMAESKVRFGDIDFTRTVAFSEELNYAPAVWFNQLGRDPGGVLKSTDRHRAFDAVERAAMSLVTLDGESLVRRAILRETLFNGPYAHQIPDVILEMNPIDGYTPAVLPSGGRSGPTVRALEADELLGRKGRSLPGCHTPEGLFIASSPATPVSLPGGDYRVEQMAHLACELLGIAPAKWHVPPGAQPTEAPNGTRRFDTGELGPYNLREEELVAERLRQLGYL